MGFTETVKGRVEEVARPALLPGEELRVAAMGTISPKLWVSLISPILQAFLTKPYYVAVTDRRFLLLRPKLTSRAADVIVADPPSAVTVVAAKPGKWVRLRLADGSERRLAFARTWRAEAERLLELLAAA